MSAAALPVPHDADRPQVARATGLPDLARLRELLVATGDATAGHAAGEGTDDDPTAGTDRRGDRWMSLLVTLLGLLALALALAPGTWAATGAVIALAGGGLAATCWAESLRRRTRRTALAQRQLAAQAAALRQHVRAALVTEERFRALHDASPVGVFHSDLEGSITCLNDRAIEQWGGVEEELLGHAWIQRVHPDDRTELLTGWGAALAAGVDYEAEYRVLGPGGAVRRMRGRSSPLRDASGRPVGTVGTVEDVTERRAAEAALAESERRFRTVVESIDQGLLVTDRDDRIVYANSRMGQITGWAPEELVGQVGSEVLVHDDEREAFLARMRGRMAGSAGRYELQMVRRDGSRVWTENGGVPFRDASGEIVGTIGVVADISERKALEGELTRQAFQDSLTGLANRARLRHQVERAVAEAVPGRAPAVLLVDLDEFKHVNDSLGHAAGDRLLVLVAERLRDATRGSDTVARLGGDEFAVLMTGGHGAQGATRVADRILSVLAAPFPLEGHEVRVGASVGIAVRDGDEGADDLLRNADLALYRAKRLGRARHALFVPEMHAAALERLALEGELRRALAERQLTLHYQPIIALDTGTVCGVEALVRWRHPVRGLVSPATFIPLAEATGLIVPLGRWVLEEACRTATSWDAAHPALSVSVNVSARQLLQDDFATDLAAVLLASGLAADRLVVEVTESVVLEDLDLALARLEAVRALGVRVALDDFGTGYSSLAYLQRLPVDALKVDRAFTAEVAAGGRSAAYARAVLTFAETLGLRTIAEGVETEAQHAELRALGCGFAQGYLYARPMDAAALAELLRGGLPVARAA